MCLFTKIIEMTTSRKLSQIVSKNACLRYYSKYDIYDKIEYIRF